MCAKLDIWFFVEMRVFTASHANSHYLFQISAACIYQSSPSVQTSATCLEKDGHSSTSLPPAPAKQLKTVPAV